MDIYAEIRKLHREGISERAIARKLRIHRKTVHKLEAKQKELEEELPVIKGMVEQMILENTRRVQDQVEYNRKRNALVEQYDQTRAKLDKVNAELIEVLGRRSAVEQFLQELREKDSPVTKFSDELWLHTVQSVRVEWDGSIVFIFKDGTEMRV